MCNRNRILLAGVCAALLCLASVTGAAQEFRAVLTGQVTDPSGALIKGATVTAVNNDSKTTYTATTTDKGVYYINYVLPGNYTVTATAQGFKTSVQQKVVLSAAQTFNQNFKMNVGSVDESIVVSTEPPRLETSTGSGGTIIGTRELENVPLNGGQAYTLIGTTTGSQFTSQVGPSGNTGTRGWDVSNSYTIGGGIVGNNQFTLNGANITSQYGYDNHSPGEFTVSPNIDSVQEVNVMTTTYDARFGRTSGGTVNVVSKSGGNQYHASARYGYEGTIFGANTYTNKLTGVPRQGQVQNQFWLTAGGPIIKNKLFFFFGFEGYRQAVEGSLLENVAPAFLRPGYNGNPGIDFGLVGQLDAAEFPKGLPIYQPGTATCLDGGPVSSCNSNRIVQTPFPNDTIPGSMINQTAMAVAKYVPLPNIPGTENLVRGNNYIGLTPRHINYNQPQIRVDYNLTDRTKLYSYFLYWKGTENRSNNGLNGLAINGNVNHIRQNWIAAQDITHVFSDTLTGDFKVAFDRFFESSPNGDLSKQVNPSTIGLSMPLPGSVSSHYLPEFRVSDGWGTGFISNRTIFGNNDNADVTNNYTLNVDFTKTHGAHTMEFGGEIDEFQFGGFPSGGGHPNGTFSFGSQWTQLDPQNANVTPDPNGSGLASFYLGLPTGGNVDWINSITTGYPVFAGYFQDNWRVTSRMTLNMGIRYDVQRGLRERHNHLNRGLCLTCVNPLTNDDIYQANVGNASNEAAWAAAGINVASLKQVLGGVQFAGANGQSRNAYDTDWSNVGPRFGFAYAVNPKTVIRGGYGIMYSYGLEGGSSVGENQSTNYVTSVDGGNTPTNYFQTGQPFASGLVAPTGNTLGLLTDVGNNGVQVDFPDRKIPIEQIMSLGFQRELPGGMVLDTRYAANFTNRLRTFLWINGTATLAQIKQAQADPSYFDKQVPNPYYGVAGISGPGQCGTSPTIKAVALLLPLSQYCSPGGTGLVGQYNAPLGGNFYNGLEVKLSKRVYGARGRGFSYQIAYTYSKTTNEDGYRNGWPYQDPERIHQLADTDRTHILSVTSVYDLPFGQGGMLFSHSPRLINSLISNWKLSGVFNAQSGTPVGINTGWDYTCGTQSYKPAGGSTLGHWFSTAGDNPQQCWTRVPPYGLMPINSRTAQVRNPTMPNLDLSLQKSTTLWDRAAFDLRLDAFNATNSVLFPGPNTDPGAGPATFNPKSGWTGFGTVSAQQQNFPRILQVSGKISF
ncbi:MAG TPA: carboxypeptidase-like regulatory domain-containing protein [Edaphobacter sp.]|nr:carboxypeptidase-like regulatory domain-containing protein [Edaphobacter sp.]